MLPLIALAWAIEMSSRVVWELRKKKKKKQTFVVLLLAAFCFRGKLFWPETLLRAGLARSSDGEAPPAGP